MDTTISKNKAQATALGALIGDALAMPAHWYYNTKALREQFGRITTYMNPPENHPDSILWRSEYPLTDQEFDILGDQRRFWGKNHVHYHQFLQAGENTLTGKLLGKLIEQVTERKDYDPECWIQTYLQILRNPGEHRDTYVEECHRGFFMNLARGKNVKSCAIQEKHIGGMVPVLPLYAVLRHEGQDHQSASQRVLDHVSLTHGGPAIEKAGQTLLTIAEELWEGADLADTLTNHFQKQDLAYLQGPLVRLSKLSPENVFGRHFSTACYLDHALPGVAYLALRYADNPETGLIENTMAGGDNCGRGAVLGALFGLAQGLQAFPTRWVDGLLWKSPW